MKKKLNILTVAGTLFSSVWANAVSLDLLPASSSVRLGDSVQVELRISGLGEGTGPSLGAYDLMLAFNPVVLGFSGFTFGDPLLGNQLDLMGFGTVAAFDGGTPGQLTAFEISLDLASDLDALQASGFALGTISFNSLGNGVSALQFTSAAFGDSAGNALPVQLGSGSVRVVPEPMKGEWIVAVAFASALGVQRMKRRQATDPATA